MVPVSLRLKNFMSYGTDVPPLDFGRFHTACLSGDNGQGKSALLDAITWALWGKARKAAGRINPSADLLRIGEDEMQVEYVFDLDRDRYRILRTFLGLRNRSFLELHGRKQAHDQFRSLSESTLSKTQKAINRVIGLDYDTFINSALLLQGRSNEFASRTPGERKEILARILNLGRYERLRRQASEKSKQARIDEKQAATDVARLASVLKKEPAWEEEGERLRERIAAREQALAEARTEEGQLIGRMARLEGLRERVDRLRNELGRISQRIKEHEDDEKAIQASIDEAETLMRREEEIKRNHRNMLALQNERQQLDDLGQIHLGFERQRDRCRRELTELRHKVEIRLKGMASKLSVARRDLDEVRESEKEAPRIQRKLDAVKMAARREAELRRIQARLAQLERRAREAQVSIEKQRSALRSRVAALRRQRDEVKSQLGDSESLARQQEALQNHVARRRDRLRALETTSQEGASVAGKLNSLQGRRKGREEQRVKIRGQLEFLGTETDGSCPTCGTALTPDHRAKVHAELQAEITRLSKQIEHDGQTEEALAQRRNKLRELWVTQNSEVRATEKAAAELAGITERLSQQEHYRKMLEVSRTALTRYERELKEENFAHEARQTLELLSKEIAGSSFDQREFDRVRHEAAQEQRYTDLMTNIRRQIARKAHLEHDVKRREEEELALRKKLDDGALFGDLQSRIGRLEAQLRKVGYDPQRLHFVKQALGRLGGAGEEMARLVSALSNRSLLKKRLAAISERKRQTLRERDMKQGQIRQLRSEIELLRDTEAALEQCRSQRRRLETTLKTLQVKLGEVGEKLAAAKVQRKEMKARKKARRRHKRDARLYGHLVQAFGKHGIPSLIIEQTLPEITRRASDLLNRLSDDQMGIRIDTQRDKKRGGTIETLDIKVKGNQGTYRAYETFSGGEAFRVNFALRIALAQLLAARHGVQMRMLIIDEGFGTQDRRGVENLLRAIAAVRNEFAKILVITHLPEVKDVFPVRIEVKKDPVVGSGFAFFGG